MSRKHHVKHHRTLSRYPGRLAKRGVSNTAVRMGDYIDCGNGESVARTNPFHKKFKAKAEGAS
jgi:hypothetical protein